MVFRTRNLIFDLNNAESTGNHTVLLSEWPVPFCAKDCLVWNRLSSVALFRLLDAYCNLCHKQKKDAPAGRILFYRLRIKSELLNENF